MVPIPLDHRDPDAFPEPDSFRPDRWLSGGANESKFLPFGGEGASASTWLTPTSSRSSP
jgi:cytochrome P450